MVKPGDVWPAPSNLAGKPERKWLKELLKVLRISGGITMLTFIFSFLFGVLVNISRVFGPKFPFWDMMTIGFLILLPVASIIGLISLAIWMIGKK